MGLVDVGEKDQVVVEVLAEEEGDLEEDHSLEQAEEDQEGAVPLAVAQTVVLETELEVEGDHHDLVAHLMEEEDLVQVEADLAGLVGQEDLEVAVVDLAFDIRQGKEAVLLVQKVLGICPHQGQRVESDRVPFHFGKMLSDCSVLEAQPCPHQTFDQTE